MKFYDNINKKHTALNYCFIAVYIFMIFYIFSKLFVRVGQPKRIANSVTNSKLAISLLRNCRLFGDLFYTYNKITATILKDTLQKRLAEGMSANLFILLYCCPVKVATLAATSSNTVIYSPLTERGLGGGGKKKIISFGFMAGAKKMVDSVHKIIILYL